MIFYERLATLLSNNKITRKKFSSDLQIGINQLKRWEDSGKLPKRAMIVAIADYFGVTTAYLLGEETDRGPSESPEGKNDPSEEELLRLWRRIPPEKRTMVLNIILAALKED